MLVTRSRSVLLAIPVLLAAACAPPPTYAQVSEQVFVPRCATTFCHGASAQPAGNIQLTREAAYDAIVGKPTTGVDWPSTPYAGLLLIDPGAPDRSAMMKSLERPDDLPQRYRMPTGEDRLTAEELALVREWIAAGAPR